MDQLQLAQVRTRLAAERTYLAWVRSGLATIGGGLAIVKLVPFTRPEHIWIAHLTGQLLIVAGGAVFIFALVNYTRASRTIEAVQGAGAAPTAWVFVVLTVFLVVISLLIFWLTI